MSKNIAAGYLDMCADIDGKYTRAMVERIIAVAYAEGKFDGLAQSARDQMDTLAVVLSGETEQASSHACVVNSGEN